MGAIRFRERKRVVVCLQFAYILDPGKVVERVGHGARVIWIS